MSIRISSILKNNYLYSYLFSNLLIWDIELYENTQYNNNIKRKILTLF